MSSLIKSTKMKMAGLMNVSLSQLEWIPLLNNLILTSTMLRSMMMTIGEMNSNRI